MAINNWQGGTTGALTWASAGNWSDGIPTADDSLNLVYGWTGDPTITTPTSAISFTDMTTGDTSGAINVITLASGNAASIWAAQAGSFFNVAAGQSVAMLFGYSGSLPIAKRGSGYLGLGTGTGSPAVTHTGGWVVEAGTLAASAAGRWGTGAITLWDGVSLYNSSVSAITQTNSITLLGSATLAAGAGNGVLTLSGSVALPATTPTLTIGAAGLTISGPITGTAGFTKAGAGVLTITSASPGLDTSVGGSAVTVPSGSIYLQPASNLANVSKWQINYDAVNTTNPATLWHWYTADTLINPGTTFSGTGLIVAYKNIASDPATGVSFPAGALAGMTGSVHALNASGIVQSGLCLFSDTTAANSRVCRVVAKDLPRLVTFAANTGAGSVVTEILTYDGVGGTFVTDIDLTAAGTAALTTGSTYRLNNNGATAPLILQGAVSCYGPTNFARTFTIGGTSTLDNALQSAISNGVATGGLGIAKADAGKWILSGANTYTGTTSVSAGTLSAQSAGAFGAAASAVTQTGGTIDVSNNTALNKTGAAFTLVSNAGANALTTTTGTNTLACAGITLNSTIIVDAAAGASLTVNNTAAMSGAFGITKNNSGEIGLGTFANTYTGAVTINAGTLTVGNLQNTSTASSLGTGALSSAIVLSGTLKYAGTAPAGHSTNRSITFTGAAPALDASGTGAVTYSACTQAAGARTITLTGTSLAAVNNTFSATLADGTGAVGVAKTGSNKWVLSGALNHTGTTSCAEGTLNLGSINRTLSGALSVSGGTVENSTNTISANTTMTGGTITAQLTGNKTLDVTSGSATLQPVNNVNDFSGNTTVAAGATLKLITGLNPSLGSGRVLGTSNVSVSGNLRTDGSVTQKGQMRYGGNLTFQAGAKLYVGSLA